MISKYGKRTTTILFAAALTAFFCASALSAQAEIPEWCRALPRPEYRSLERVFLHEPWFEVYKVEPGVVCDRFEPAPKARAGLTAILLHGGQQLEENLLRDVVGVRGL